MYPQTLLLVFKLLLKPLVQSLRPYRLINILFKKVFILSADNITPFKTIANFDTLEEMQNEKQDKEDTKNTTKADKTKKEKINVEDSCSLQDKISELCNSNECMAKKMITLNDKINDTLKTICCKCRNSKALVSNEASQHLCVDCNAIFCNDCVSQYMCIRCHKKLCDNHCIKCQLCNKRCCKEKSCIYDFKICQLCECTYCQEHFDLHKKYNIQELYKMKCNVEQCKISNPETPKLLNDITSGLIHLRALKEIKIRTILHRK